VSTILLHRSLSEHQRIPPAFIERGACACAGGHRVAALMHPQITQSAALALIPIVREQATASHHRPRFAGVVRRCYTSMPWRACRR
jgi:hypothetical protein